MWKTGLGAWVPLLFTLLLVSPVSWGDALQCRTVLSAPLQTARERFNAELTERYPQLAFVTRDPDAFTHQMQERFEQQKKRDYRNRFHFDYSEMGMPLVRDIRAQLQTRVDEWGQRLAKLREQGERKTKLAKFVSFHHYRETEIKVALEYLKDLQAECETYLRNDKISYRDLIEFTYFYSRAVGHFDTRPQGPILRLLLFLDRSMNGYKQLSIQDEYRLYRDRRFSVFQKPSVVKTFRIAEKPFADVFTGDTLETVWVPTNANVGRDIFLQLMTQRVNLIGVTLDPILADGTLRPGGDFYNHDVRHESFKYYEQIAYIEKHGLSEEQALRLNRKSDEWLLQMNEEIQRLQDPDQRGAIEHVVFNFHHDSGYPLIPSAYLFRVQGSSARNLYILEKISGQGVLFRGLFRNLEFAEQWLTEFWTKRYAEELALLREISAGP